MDRLSAEDTRILRLESEAIAGHTMKLAITEPAPTGGPSPWIASESASRCASAGLPRARQRLAPTPLRVAPPAWVDDDGFDIRRHVRLASEPVTDRDALIGFVGKVMAERLDHERPLWCVDVVGPDDVGRTALVIRIHHCLADG